MIEHVILLFLTLTFVSCGPARRGQLVERPVVLSSAAEKAGHRIFMENCHRCHPWGTAGVGPSLNDKPLPETLIDLQVRHGVGAMPAFGDQTIKDKELEDLSAYLIALRKSSG